MFTVFKRFCHLILWKTSHAAICIILLELEIPYFVAEKGPGAWDYELSTQLATKLLMIDSSAGLDR
jgi:hypothetical protein